MPSPVKVAGRAPGRFLRLSLLLGCNEPLDSGRLHPQVDGEGVQAGQFGRIVGREFDSTHAAISLECKS